MDYKDFKNESGEKVRLRPRRKVGESRTFGEKKNFGERKPYGERHSYGEQRNYGDRPAHNNDSRPSFNNDRPSFNGGERKPYGERRSYGNRPSHNNDRQSFNGGERKPYGERRSYGDRPSYNNDRPSFNGGERKPYGERRSYGDRPSYNNDRPSFNGGERKPYGERRSYGDRPSFNGGERKPYGERRGYGNKPSFKGGERKPYGAGSRGFGAKKSISRKQYEDFSHFRNEEESGISRMIDNRQIADTPAVMHELEPSVMRGEVRLNKFIANSGICSRREADNFILAGVVTVNGVPVTELGSKVNVDVDDIRFNGERIHGEEKVYIVMNKPKGYVTTTTDPHAEKTVMDLLKGCNKRVFPVGRLDKNTTGVLMFTNDGEIAEKLTHPAYDKKKIYQVSLDHNLTDEDREKILSGVTLSDGDICADALEFIEDDDHRKVGIEIHSGKNRIVRRIFESLGYDVKALDRVYFAGLTKKSLKRGEWRYLTDKEINILRMGAYI